jgi:hypothetical protein
MCVNCPRITNLRHAIRLEVGTVRGPTFRRRFAIENRVPAKYRAEILGCVLHPNGGLVAIG